MQELVACFRQCACADFILHLLQPFVICAHTLGELCQALDTPCIFAPENILAMAHCGGCSKLARAPHVIDRYGSEGPALWWLQLPEVSREENIDASKCMVDS